jgi:hypothetical protein
MVAAYRPRHGDGGVSRRVDGASRALPPRGEDEPWIAAAPAKLAAEGVLGNDLFTGYYGMERHHLQHMPVYPLLEAVVFKAFGIGVCRCARCLSLSGFC